MPAAPAAARSIALSLALALPGSGAAANAWQREPGTSFLSFSVQSTVNGVDFGEYASLYYEYGLTNGLTLGLDAGRNLVSSDSSAIFFVQTPLFTSGANLFAFDLGIGVADVASERRATLRPGLAWGRPYTAPWGNGWMGVDATYAFYEGGEALGKVDATFGINHASGSLSLAQLQFAAPSGGDATFGLAPSHVMKISDNSFIELGALYEFRNGVTAIKLGIWTTF
ncbi:hypothetical protein Q4543_19380 [Salipiger sp. 1_MG-2023]|uniref:hypothetical protein n=1 Tax=Salipiger sp. 1_MG-2023 TaxID=3062665 RepID=UPI0026E4547A|nr:hypothetical protein [Salipiger sp. 1_MG-2023]MDO6587678.1 hypothetical protein [Salipiger sp. 1_MG-2023]